MAFENIVAGVFTPVLAKVASRGWFHANPAAAS